MNKIITNIGEITILRAAEDDLSDVLRLWLEAAEWLEVKGILQWRPNSFTQESVLEHYQKTELYIAKLNETIVGSFSIQWSDEFIWEELNNNSSGYIHRLVVARNFKGMNLGIELLTWAERYIQSTGKKASRLDCMADNQHLNTFYRKAGYNYIKRINRKYWSASLFEKVYS
ncbi:GNAT family N-acetyltransferase [Paenibacillus hexagrammi]|uniref:GNAT family N-acetyltransferase n=1 Tax=Paenibacillus hexagrammi TaxID=2908839 RepID=A0ABY3SNK9_9BACL|nr:GNAT family N-acetyltransferase [Paenibacillus sp. YPD9-1]UJF35508.1 GNAT family N-acetyltransferase [Paenibacillus sp. YPD9-1]